MLVVEWIPEKAEAGGWGKYGNITYNITHHTAHTHMMQGSGSEAAGWYLYIAFGRVHHSRATRALTRHNQKPLTIRSTMWTVVPLRMPRAERVLASARPISSSKWP